MQSVLSVQAARADKATEKREMEGKTVCKAGQSNCNMVLGVVGEALILGHRQAGNVAGSKRLSLPWPPFHFV